MVQPLSINLIQYQDQLQLKKEEGKTYIFDPIRQKYLVLQPEEVVRQLLICFLIDQGFNKNRIAIEKLVMINGKRRRFDLLVYHYDMRPYMLVECKSADVDLNQKTLDQIARYNLPLQADYLFITNGIHSFCCQGK